MMMMMLRLPLFLVLLGIVSIINAADLFVEEGGSGTTCESIEDACGSIQEAIDVSTSTVTSRTTIHVGSGTFIENIVINKDGLALQGSGAGSSIIVSAGGIDGVESPEGVAADIIIDIAAKYVKVDGFTITHPEGVVPTKRDIGIFVKPPAVDVQLYNLIVERNRTNEEDGTDDDDLEPTTPGSRGLLVYQSPGTWCKDSWFRGNYQDHIHLPTSYSNIAANVVTGATRLGIVVIQEESDSMESEAKSNSIVFNNVTQSGSDGIQIQGDVNDITGNIVYENGGYGIHICYPESDGPKCVEPGEMAFAIGTKLGANDVRNNTLGDIQQPPQSAIPPPTNNGNINGGGGGFPDSGAVSHGRTSSWIMAFVMALFTYYGITASS